jgi:6-phosphogluconate dehydrogenase
VTQIGFVGLGKMGANMVHRICRDSEHEVVAYDSNRDAVKSSAANGAVGANTLSDLVRELKRPRIVWLMLPAGEITQRTIDRLSRMLDRDDTIVDGGNTKWTEDKRRAAALKKLGIHYVDVGTSGGVWGLEVGYCMMVGGANKAVGRLAPILDVLAPETAENARAAIGERGWMHFGPAGAGHFVKMVHNGIEYGLMQAYAEGFDLFDKCEYELDNAKIAHLWGQGSVVRSWLCELAARAFEADGNDLHTLTGYTEDSGEGRWTIAEATARDVPTPVMTASLYSRFYSRGEGDYSHRVLAALRNQFGGHAVHDAEGDGPGKAGAEPTDAGSGQAGREPAGDGRKPRASTRPGRASR